MTFDRTWTFRMRSLVKKRLSSKGIMPIPKDFEFSCQIINKTKSIRIKRPPAISEQSSKHLYVEFDESNDSLEFVLSKVENMVKSYERIIAREEELIKKGFSPTKAPLEFLEGPPLIAWLYRAKASGIASFSGNFFTREGILRSNDYEIWIPGNHILCINNVLHVRADMPDTYVSNMKGRPLGNIIEFPTCGNIKIDKALADLEITHAEKSEMPYEGGPCCNIGISRGQVLPMTEKTGSWMSMEPVPLC